MMIAIELMRGLDKLNIPYRFNDFKYAKNHPNELIGVIGKPHLIFEQRFKNPILFGAGVFSHPIESLDFFERYPNVKKMLVPGEWMRRMCEPFYGEKVLSWAVGIDTDHWRPINGKPPKYELLIYNKLGKRGDVFEETLIDPIIKILNNQQIKFQVINYGFYTPSLLKEMLTDSKAVIFLCEHETQGIAYQQILSTNTPILAYDPGGYWKDPAYYPHLVKYKPTSSVPYWDFRCGEKFNDIAEFEMNLSQFLMKANNGEYHPRQYIIENLSLEVAARKYIEIYKSTYENLANR